MLTRSRRRRTSSAALVESLEGRLLMSANMPAKLPDRALLAPATLVAAARKPDKQPAPELSTAPTGTNTLPAPAFALTPTTAAATVNPLGGDTNADWTVNSFDLNTLSSNWLATDATWAMGDFNGDTLVDAFDLNILSANWLVTLTPPTPPTPLAPTVSYDWRAETINGVLNVWAPNPSDFGGTYTVSDPSKLFGPDGIPNIEGVKQGPIGDCYFLAAIGGTARDRPAAIMNMVKEDATGGWAVTFQWKNSAGVTLPVTFHTSKELSSYYQTEANGEVWSLVMEKAYAAFRTFNGATSTNTMASIAWGYAGDAMRYIGQPFTAWYTSGQSETAVFSQMSGVRAQGRPILFHTSKTAPSMIASHVYTVTDVFMDAAGQKQVTTYNPWGFYETRTLTDLMRNSAGQLVIATA